MEVWLGLAALVVLLVPLARAISRGTELFAIRVEAGQCRFLRGKMPQGLLDEIADVLSGTGASGLLRAQQERGSAVLSFKGQFSEATQQQLRNVLGMYPLARIKAGYPPRR